MEKIKRKQIEYQMTQGARIGDFVVYKNKLMKIRYFAQSGSICVEDVADHQGYIAEPKNLIFLENTKHTTVICKKPRDFASELLGQVELYGDFYYAIEDHLTNSLETGVVKDLPLGTESEYLKCALRIEVRDYFDQSEVEDLESEDVENVVNKIIYHFSENVLNQELIQNEVQNYLENKKDS